MRLVAVTLNGEPTQLDDPSLTAAVVAAGVDPSRAGVAVAVNGEIVPRSRWEAASLHDGDRVDVVTAAQGGAR